MNPLYPFAGRTIDRPGGRLHFLDEGAGDPVVMLHGNPTWSFYYRNLVLALRGQYRCVAPDHIGCGLSDKPPESLYDYSLRSRIDDLEQIDPHQPLLGVDNCWTEAEPHLLLSPRLEADDPPHSLLEAHRGHKLAALVVDLQPDDPLPRRRRTVLADALARSASDHGTKDHQAHHLLRHRPLPRNR